MSSDFERFVDWAKFLGCNGREAFDKAADLLDHFGVEGVSCGDDSMDYLNTGDTYSETIVLTSDGELLCTTWGNWYENAEREHCEENSVIRCGYCGEFTDDSYYGDEDDDCDKDWHDIVCQSCGNRVGG